MLAKTSRWIKLRLMIRKSLFVPRPIKQNNRKFKELILYIAQEYGDAKYSGGVKLNKTLFAIDFSFFEEYGRPITGSRYKKDRHGFVPYSIIPVMKEMIADGEIRINREKVDNQMQNRPMCLRPPNMRIFSEEERRIIDKWIADLKNEKATSVSDWTHKLPLWDFGDEQGFVSYERIYWNVKQDAKITSLDKQAIKEINDMYGNVESFRWEC
jgi:hypothetical protein